ncbi:MAG TPA: hypothetical protein VEC18_09500, partial [Myxococcota bacterium]|nr:hypothetical protein [Myxococcota bacterium]
MATDRMTVASARTARRRARGCWAAALALAVFAALRVAAVYTAAGNWDEFGLLENAAISHETGVLRGGGRPGLAQLAVLPLVAGCDDEMQVLQRARLLWVAITLAYLVGVGVLAVQCQRACGGALAAPSPPEGDRSVAGAVLAVALLALVPAFLQWSIQVRTDQIALAGGVWGGIALLASLHRPALALAAGALLALGFLSSQKLLYVAALVALLALAQLDFGRRARWPRDALRAALCAAGCAACLLAVQLLVARDLEIDRDRSVLSETVVRSGLSSFDFYRNTIGWSLYRTLLPTLIPHAVLLAGLVAATFSARRRRQPIGAALATAWSILLLGAAVCGFHAAAFPYFWMTLGLFPALAFALARRPIGALASALGRVRPLAVAAFWLGLAGPGMYELFSMLGDAQKVQRDSLAFIHASFEPTAAGFHPESALFCRGDAQPLNHFFSADIYRRFGRPGSEANRARFIQQFRDERILFILDSFRLNQFPVEIRRFWADNYQPYRAAVYVAGRQLAGERGSSSEFDLVAAGEYRWIPSARPMPIEVNGRRLAPGET